MQRLLFRICLLLLSGMLRPDQTCQAQQTIPYDSAVSVLNRIMRTYQSDTLQRMIVHSGLYFQDAPTVKIDSLEGSYYLKGSAVLARLDNATYLKNDRWSVDIYDDFQEMYIDSAQNETRLNLKGNPLQLVDSSYFDPQAAYESYTNQDSVLLRIQFSNEPQVSEAIIVYNRKNHRILFARYVIPAHLEEALGEERTYILTMQFEEPFIDENATTLFNERRYFYFDESMQPHGAGAFKEYKITMTFTPPGSQP